MKLANRIFFVKEIVYDCLKRCCFKQSTSNREEAPMNKTAIKNFAIWARNKLIAEIRYKAGLLGITEKEIKSPLPQSTQTVQFFDIGTKEPYSITSVAIEQRKKLAEEIQRKASQTDYK